ncbi:DNA-processing protein DprA [Cesiribacter sp. SM1]|uniref:DNA-processing protein DprA n=1 Tax=Cesiribacter sp. SM1 TaxID=2861196 RepID=UPI001CD5FC7A|nr:DNA-processing protein DprA [Cesiribacter sp. SM1]
MEQEKLCQVALTRVAGVGPLLAKNLVSYCGSAAAVFSSNRNKLSRVPGIGEKILSNLALAQPLKEAESILQRAQQEALQILMYTEADYPYRLKQIADAPIVLYYRGKSSLNHPRTIAIVGTRKATSYGRTVTEQMVESLLPYQPLVVSGLAYGIDVIAHRACLKAGLATIGVMASGPDIIYPPAHRSTATDMLRDGGLLTEYPFGTQPDAYNFPARNRIIAGMADAVVVIEAAAKGGALITAELALDYNREVFAVPGSLMSEYSAGCHALISRQQAHIYRSAEDLVNELRWNSSKEEKKPLAASIPDLSEREQAVVNLLEQQPAGYQIDELSWRSQIPLSQLAGVLLELELKGLVRALPGKKFALSL